MSILHKYTIRHSKVQQLRNLRVQMSIMADYEKVEVLAKHRDRKINTYN
jgi:hypothetical protein